MPLLLLLPLLLEFLTIGVIVLDVYLIHEWYTYRNTYLHDHARYCLYGAIAITAYSFLGGSSMKLILSKRKKGEDEPCGERSNTREVLVRPDGTQINIEFEGNASGEPILFVHGWMANSTEWYYQKKFFGRDHRVILIDLAGLGKSTRPKDKDFSLQKMAADLDAVITHLKLSKLTLWGHSIGGMTILTYCKDFKANAELHVISIVLQHTTFTNPIYTSILSGLLKAIEKPVLYPLCYLMIALSPLFWLNKWMSYLNGHSHISTRLLSFAGTQTAAQLDFITRLSALAPPAITARGVLGMLKTYDVTNDLDKIKIPALIIAADKDRLTKPVASEFMDKKLPNSKMVVISPAGHQGLIERHEEVNRAAKGFIDSLINK
ncbi:MAG TPA: alpha/beta hydrolase [Bacteroidia bacterium]|jgi:pimeloyl-ACP methyl ester carboxylesterase